MLPGFRLTMGFTVFYLCLIVLDPAADAAGCGPRRMTWDAFWQTITDPRVVASYRLSIGASLVAAVRQRGLRACSSRGCSCATSFPGRRIVDALIDLPFALPTAVAGITLTTLYAPNGWLGAPLEPLRHQGRVHAARRHDRADLHRPAVRRPDAAAGHRGSRSGGRGGGDQPRRDAGASVLARVILPYLYPGVADRLRAGVRARRRRVRIGRLHLRQHADASPRSRRCSSSPSSSSSTTPARRRSRWSCC